MLPLPSPQSPKPGQRNETIRRANLAAVVREIHRHGALSRSEIAARTGLSRGTIRRLIGELTRLGLVSEGSSAVLGGPSRSSSLVEPCKLAAVVLAIEIAVDSVAVAVVGFGGEVLSTVRIDRPRGRTSVDLTISDLFEIVEGLLERTRTREALVGIGVGVDGIVRRSDGLVHLAPNLGWRDVPLGELLAEALGSTVPIVVANGADLGALAEHRRGAAVLANNVVYLSGEVGVGGGVIVDGRPLCGVAGYAGEVGHMPVNPDGVACSCGSFGCLETELGEGALLVRAGHAASEGRSGVDRLLLEAAVGVPAALSALETTGRWLGVGLATLINVFNPEVIVLGRLFGRLHPFTAASMEAELDRRALRASRERVRVVPAALGAEGALIGAAELAFEPLLSDPIQWAPPRVASSIPQAV
jgi:predicted NBD/HSP70 family sugar kinase